MRYAKRPVEQGQHVQLKYGGLSPCFMHVFCEELQLALRQCGVIALYTE